MLHVLTCLEQFEDPKDAKIWLLEMLIKAGFGDEPITYKVEKRKIIITTLADEQGN